MINSWVKSVDFCRKAKITLNVFSKTVSDKSLRWQRLISFQEHFTRVTHSSKNWAPFPPRMSQILCFRELFSPSSKRMVSAFKKSEEPPLIFGQKGPMLSLRFNVRGVWKRAVYGNVALLGAMSSWRRISARRLLRPEPRGGERPPCSTQSDPAGYLWAGWNPHHQMGLQ